jgi:hypothetical protein
MWNVSYRFSLYSERLFHGPHHREDPFIAHPAITAKPSTLIGKGGIIRSQLNVTQKYLPTTDGAGRIKNKVEARLVGRGDCQGRSKDSAVEMNNILSNGKHCVFIPHRPNCRV